MQRYTISKFDKLLGTDAAEERSLLDTWVQLSNKLMDLHMGPFETDLKATKALQAEIDAVVKKLGYNPVDGRPSRPRGRVKTIAIPHPLPQKGTVLYACSGAEYVVEGYLCSPTSTSQTIIVYYDRQSERMVARSLIHLFAGSLATNEPFVTWPDDPRKLKPDQPIPLNKRRSLSKAELKADRHYNPSLIPETPEELARRMPFLRHKKAD